MKRSMLCVVLAACGAQRQAVRAAPADDEPFFCSYKKPGYFMPPGVLSLTPGGPTVLTFDEREARATGLELRLPWGSAEQPVKGAFTTGWVTYRMYLRPTQPLRVYPLRAVQFGVLELGPYAPLEFLGTQGDGMRVRSPEVPEFRSGRPLEASLKCTETAISPGRWSLDDAPRDAGSPRRLELLVGVDIPVSMTPGGSTDGTLHLKDDPGPDLATLLEELDEHVRVRYRVGSGRVTGWVHRRFTKPTPPPSNVFGVGGLLGGLGTRGGGGGEGKPSWPRCKAGVPLFLLEGGELSPAGELQANAAYEVVGEHPGYTEITLPENAWLKLQPGYAWAFKAGDLEVCRTRPPDRSAR